MSDYDRKPTKHIPECRLNVFSGIDEITRELGKALQRKGRVIALECYPGVDVDTVFSLCDKLRIERIIDTRNLFKDYGYIQEYLRVFLTDDRVFGRMYYGALDDFLDENAVVEARQEIVEDESVFAVVGTGASLVIDADVLVYLDINRWEIQLRYRKGMPNLLTHNPDDDTLRKIKQGYFVEWRIADKLKQMAFKSMDYFIDMNVSESPVMINSELFRKALRMDSSEPFRLVPYFDPGVWGGHWMEEHLGLGRNGSNYAWSFDGVPEEDSLRFDFDGVSLEMPAMNLVLSEPIALLGCKVYSRFGAEFPIRFDFLDTMGGENLSLQVHPSTEYIHRTFGMAYTQDESYYILDAAEDSCVYLGLTEDCDIPRMIADLKDANDGGRAFDAEKYVNVFPARKHDHFLIPAGTCHCSGRNTMVLEISATPYIFTFKLWDWGRLGLDGRPRPVHVDHGQHVIADRRTSWVKENLINQERTIVETDSYKEEHTGLHELEFIETRRFSIWSEARISCHDSVNVLNLVEGDMCIVQSVYGSFSDYVVHYAETFIVPASVREYRIKADMGPVKVIQAYVRV